MWSKSYSIKVKNLDYIKAWNTWINVNEWNTWQSDIDFAKLDNKMGIGAIILFKPKGAPIFKLEVTEFIEGKKFTDLTKFPFAKMYDEHEILIHEDEIELKTTISIEGPLSFFWRKIVVDQIIKGLPAQTDSLIKKVMNG